MRDSEQLTVLGEEAVDKGPAGTTVSEPYVKFWINGAKKVILSERLPGQPASPVRETPPMGWR